MFFEIKEDVLLNSVPASSIEKLATPPAIPANVLKGKVLPSVDSTIQVVTLKRTECNPLVTSNYATELFKRVELYFLRFFSSENSKVSVDEVKVILNKQTLERFRTKENQLHTEGTAFADMENERESDLNKFYLQQLSQSANLIRDRNSNPVAAWHGVSSSKIESIMWYGLLNLSTTDDGYYGKGIYLTQQPKYGEHYTDLKKKENGQFELLLCWVLLGHPYAQNVVTIGSPCKDGYDSHYVLVTKKKADSSFCQNNSDFLAVKNLDQFFPVIDEKQESVQGDEIVVFQSEQVLPRFVVKYTVSSSNTAATSPFSTPSIDSMTNSTINSPSSPTNCMRITH